MSDYVFGERLALTRCPHCSVHSPNLVVRERTCTSDSEGKNNRYWKMYACGSCGGVVVASADKNEQTAKVVEYFPKAKDDTDISVPKRVRHFLTEAAETTHAPYASIMSSAAAIEAMLAHHGYTEGPLMDRIDLALIDNLITRDIARWAKILPLETINQRYSDTGPDLPQLDDAGVCLQFAQSLALMMFTIPMRMGKDQHELMMI